jgi:hypothetical protein
MVRRTHIVAAVMLAVLSAGLAGCGGGGGGGGSDGSGGGATVTSPAPVPTDDPISRARQAADQQSRQQRQLDTQTGQEDPTQP